MVIGTNKEALKDEWIKPKAKLREARLKAGLSPEYLAGAIGVNRKQYDLKEKGVFAFKDYEMAILSHLLKKSVNDLFF